jgi:ubiquinone/menaquinone biosynthesis C-methylase UbiE
MIFKHIQLGLKVADEEFDAVYPDFIRDLSAIHFTPVNVTKAATRFLVRKANAKVLDVGSGAGKFCLIGAACIYGR